MSQVTYAANDRSVPESTLVELFFDALDRYKDKVAFRWVRSPTEITAVSHGEALALVRRIAAGLEERGVGRGDRVAILSENRPEWALTDYACLCAGVLGVPVYATLTASQVGYILQDSGAKVIFASTAAQVDKGVAAAKERGLRLDVVSLDGPSDAARGVVSWHDFLAAGEQRMSAISDADFRRAAMAAKPGDVATVLYTSGTTGEPKGVMLTHNNIASNVRACAQCFPIGPTDSTLSFLPLSHILQRMVDYLFFWVGCEIAYPRSVDTVVADLKAVHPTVVIAVPRIFEKVYNGVMDAKGWKKSLVAWAVRVADRAADVRLAGKSVNGALRLEYALADRLVFSKIKRTVGGSVRFFVSGGGPLSPVLNRFFYSMGLPILEGYGLTETSPVTNVNTFENFRIGSVGKPVPGTQVRIAQDGEILVRGPQVMKGYYNRPQMTAECVDEDGWFSTGDIGVIDADGFLTITDRKKDLIVTAGGKNVAPQPIENRLKTHPLVEQVVMIGDKRRYCSLLVVPAFRALEAWAQANGMQFSTREELVGDPRVVAFVEKEVLGTLGDLAPFERPKKIALLPYDLTVDNGFLTPSLKVRRRVVQEKLDALIDRLYGDEAADATQ